MHPEKQPSFQYISCYSLSHPASQSSAHVRVSIHLMLLFIVFKPLASDSDTLFQYISCYSLSAIEKVILIAKKFQYISCYSLSEICISKKLFFLSFNTSHVTLYHFAAAVLAFLSMFQYISCYSLSAAISDAMSALTTFQYISCYSLSCLSDIDFYRAILFQYISCYSLSNLCYKSGPFLHVSIHLMLLFIINHQKKKL